MIRYALRCRRCGHGFDGWFRSSADFDAQGEAGHLACPVCDARAVDKALMRPAIAAAPGSGVSAGSQSGPTGGAVASAPSGEAAALYRRMQEMARKVRAEGENVGAGFAEEARRIHRGEAEERQIWGQASGREVRRLLEDGIPALPLPPLPEDRN
ncbi:DUF1178 family protein [Aureimonas flava]|uniref:DUF1178 family protein n=1 Tax=Aureimonas flava TaxID=2320271 RepID=A0A3A1WI64_9HYPH|nr:DUF1178 family protein [Aureimonas flava]RIX99215.1 DUF1178 family protein [Aureimonas flava]